MKTIEINGETFEVIRSWKYDFARKFKFTGYGLSHFYQKPSQVKKDIYEYWRKWACNADNVHYLQVRTANGRFFTLEAVYMDDVQVYGYIEITKNHNRLYVLHEPFTAQTAAETSGNARCAYPRQRGDACQRHLWQNQRGEGKDLHC